MKSFSSALLLCVATLTACSRGDGPQTVPTVLGVSDPNRFLQFLNPQVSLPVGDYRIVAATATAGQTGPYTLTITRDDGSVQTVTGSWASSGGQVPLAASNPTTALEMTFPGGVTLELTSATADAYLYLLDRTNAVVAEDNNSGGGTNARIALPMSKIISSDYAQAYYAMIDPLNERDTIEKWKTTNGFGAGDETHVIFRDVRDLGYGRNMRVRRDAASGDVAAWVENYQVTAVPGQNYTALNLDAAIASDRRWHVGTNAIEYSNGPAGAKIVKYYTFAPDGTRLLMANIDGRGPKAMPSACISCHGGRADPLKLNAAGAWVFPRQGNVFGRMQGIDVGSVDFVTASPYTRGEQEAALKQINKMILCTYPLSAPTAHAEDACRPATVAGEWTGATGATIVKNWYGGDGMPSPTFADTYVPTDWTPGTALWGGGSVPVAADTVYREVIASSCRTCHALRGTNNQSDIDFSRYETTLSSSADIGTGNEWGYTERIKSHVFENGKMPLALLVFDAFWESPTRPSLLAGFLPYTLTDSDGAVLRPGRPIAKPGPNRTTTTPVKLSAAASQYANTFQWSLVSSAGGTPTLTNANTARPTFNATLDGVYVLRLVVGNGTVQSDPADVTVTVLNGSWGAVPRPEDIRFSHIRSILQSAAPVLGGSAAAGCSACHNPGGGYNMPVFYSDHNRVGNGSCALDATPGAYATTGPCADAANLHQFYLDIRTRVNFADPADSLILRKPTGNHHGGGLITGGFNRGSGGDQSYYNIFLNWILNGAPE